MKTQKKFFSIYKTLGLLVCALAFAPGAQAETTNCTAITSLPAVITTQGVYCFTGNLSTAITSGFAIEIQTNNVTLDLNGFKLGGLAAGDGTGASGIFAWKRKNITIRNGIVRGFRYGISLSDSTPFTTSQGHLVEDILADQNTNVGIALSGRGMTLRRNQVVDTGGSTVMGAAFAISVNGSGNDILNNRITTTVATSGGDGAASGISVGNANSGMIQNNRVDDTQADGTGDSIGIRVGGANYVTVSDNTVVTAKYGIFYVASSGVYRDNTADNISTTKYSGGTDGGGNF